MVFLLYVAVVCCNCDLGTTLLSVLFLGFVALSSLLQCCMYFATEHVQLSSGEQVPSKLGKQGAFAMQCIQCVLLALSCGAVLLGRDGVKAS